MNWHRMWCGPANQTHPGCSKLHQKSSTWNLWCKNSRKLPALEPGLDASAQASAPPGSVTAAEPCWLDTRPSWPALGSRPGPPISSRRVLELWARRSAYCTLCSQHPKFGLLWASTQSLSRLFAGSEAGPAAPAGALQDAPSQQAGGLDCDGDWRMRPALPPWKSPGSAIFVPLSGRNLRTGASCTAGSPWAPEWASRSSRGKPPVGVRAPNHLLWVKTGNLGATILVTAQGHAGILEVRLPPSGTYRLLGNFIIKCLM